jgi:hypothetical protein
MARQKRTSTRSKSLRQSDRRVSVAKLITDRGTVADFARDLSRLTGQEISWARVNAWKIRDTVPKQMLLHVHRLTGVELSKLLR